MKALTFLLLVALLFVSRALTLDSVVAKGGLTVGAEKATLDLEYSPNRKLLSFRIVQAGKPDWYFLGTINRPGLVSATSSSDVTLAYEGSWTLVGSGKATWARGTVHLIASGGKLTQASYVFQDYQSTKTFKTSGGLRPASGTCVIKVH